MLEMPTTETLLNPAQRKPAGFWIRVAAYFIDFLILLIFAVGSLFMKSVGAYLLLMLPMIAYKPVLEGLLGGTAGKLALGIRVVNPDGRWLGLAGAFVRSGIFILPVIPNMMLQIKMIEQGISPMDPEAVQAFQEGNELLYIAYYGLSILVVISCLMVAFHKRKRGLHDLVADSYVVYLDREPEAE
jgi:uncharacterized RDD family membrane protein YckC